MKKHDDLQTPAWVYENLGNLDLDPCAGENTHIANINWAIERGDNGLERPWHGLVFCNPPFSQKELWIAKMCQHGNGILLLPERGSAPWFGPLAKHAGNYFVLGKKINFVGGPSSNNLGSVLFLFGREAVFRVALSRLPGHMVSVSWYTPRD